MRLLLTLLIALVATGTHATPRPAYPIAVVELLRKHRTAELEARLSQVQSDFERGKATEYDLRNAFRPFYSLDPELQDRLAEWAARSKDSYVVQLARGISLRMQGERVRGTGYRSQLSAAQAAEADRYFFVADGALEDSLTLTAKPYLSIFHLMAVTQRANERQRNRALLAQAEAMLPNGALVRNRFAIQLLPEWGGSYAALDSFIAENKAKGLSQALVDQLVAIQFDAYGRRYAQLKRHAEAMENFTLALQLGQTLGEPFVQDFLQSTLYHACRPPRVHVLCP